MTQQYMRCKADVYSPGGGYSGPHRCTRRAIGNTEWCKTHNPEAVHARRQAQFHREWWNSSGKRTAYAEALHKIAYIHPLSDGDMRDIARRALELTLEDYLAQQPSAAENERKAAQS